MREVVGRCSRCSCAVYGIGAEKSGMLLCDPCRELIVKEYDGGHRIA